MHLLMYQLSTLCFMIPFPYSIHMYTEKLSEIYKTSKLLHNNNLKKQFIKLTLDYVKCLT